MKKKIIAMLTAALVLSLALHADSKLRCFTIHGRLFVSNGTPSVRVWIVGTKRILGAQPVEQLPPNVRRYLQFGTNIYADFLVCPLEPDRAGWMRSVEIRSVKRMVIEKFIDGYEEPTVFRVD